MICLCSFIIFYTHRTPNVSLELMFRGLYRKDISISLQEAYIRGAYLRDYRVSCFLQPQSPLHQGCRLKEFERPFLTVPTLSFNCNIKSSMHTLLRMLVHFCKYLKGLLLRKIRSNRGKFQKTFLKRLTPRIIKVLWRTNYA